MAHDAMTRPSGARCAGWSRRDRLHQGRASALQSRPMSITKLDAATRQMNTAIELYFHELDEVSIHTLAAAAHNLLTDLSSAAPQQTVIQRYIRPGKLREFENAIRAPQNFLKHADRDPAATLDLDLHATELSCSWRWRRIAD
jgi:hypothetical protein